jgi:restriction system protein
MNSEEKSDQSDSSDKSDKNNNNHEHILPPHGGYRELKSFQCAELVYDGTVIFCDRFIDKRSRTHDQMVQGARSGRQNIAEGSMASATSKKTELKLTNVAKSSLEELLLDYEDFLRHRRMKLWDKESPEARAVRGKYKEVPVKESDMSDQSDKSDLFDPYGIAIATAEAAANTLLCLINQATYLLKRQIERQEKDFLEHGGITERLYQKRSEFRKRQSDMSDASDKSDRTPAPSCPQCSKPMKMRTARKGAHAGKSFWGCSGYPECKGIRQVQPESDKSDLSDQSDALQP